METALEFANESIPPRFDVAKSSGAQRISVAVADPDRDRRKSVAGSIVAPLTGAVREISDYLPTVEDARWLSEQGFDAVFVSMDGDSAAALRTVESLCFLGRITVIVYSGRQDNDLFMRSVRAGAREFLTLPFDHAALEEVLDRVAERTQLAPVLKKKTAGKSFVFLGAKGGAGVTTIACNFAVNLARDTTERVLLIDLDLPLGDAALNLGLHGEQSTISALEQSDRLDSTFLSHLLVQHESGLSVLGAPGQFTHHQIVAAAVDRLLTVASHEFDYVVIDAGSRFDWTRTQLFENASRIYLVTQVGIPELRNSNRLITESIPQFAGKMDVVLNRYAPKVFGMIDSAIEKTLTKAPQWKIPSDYRAVMEMQNQAAAMAGADFPIARVIRSMAKSACGQSAEPEKKSFFKRFA
jgi:pilus assembly protein CpaE